MEGPHWVPVGKIVRAHGVRGAVKIYPYGETLSVKNTGDELYIRRPHAAEQTKLTVVSLKPQGKCWVGQFRELTSMNEAQEMVGGELFLPEDLLPPLEEGEYYHYQLIGLTVETTSGMPLGTLREILETGSHDVYAVEREGREVLIPAVEEVICHIDLEGRRMVVDLPEGLADDF